MICHYVVIKELEITNKGSFYDNKVYFTHIYVRLTPYKVYIFYELLGCCRNCYLYRMMQKKFYLINTSQKNTYYM